jgi:hypothetical protein
VSVAGLTEVALWLERQVKELGSRVVAQQADVRERAELREVLESALAQLGRLDIVIANAGIMPMRPAPADAQDFIDATDVDLIGVMNTVGRVAGRWSLMARPAVVGKAELPVARLFGSSDAFDDFVEYPREVAVVVESVDATNEAHHHSVEEGQDRRGLIVDEAGIGWLFGILPSSDGLARQGGEV